MIRHDTPYEMIAGTWQPVREMIANGSRRAALVKGDLGAPRARPWLIFVHDGAGVGVRTSTYHASAESARAWCLAALGCDPVRRPGWDWC